jgi:hypothetical protein
MAHYGKNGGKCTVFSRKASKFRLHPEFSSFKIHFRFMAAPVCLETKILVVVPSEHYNLVLIQLLCTLSNYINCKMKRSLFVLCTCMNYESLIYINSALESTNRPLNGPDQRFFCVSLPPNLHNE